MIDLLKNNDHYDAILDLFENVKNQITIISPFLNLKMAQKLCDCVSQNNIECNFVTRLYLEDFVCKANNIDAIEMMIDSGINVFAQKYLHTKLYLFDDNVGIIGSANFTSGGFISNIELSLMISNEPELLSKISEYCDEQLSLLNQSNDGKVTKELAAMVKGEYLKLVNKKAHGVTYNRLMYGAEIGRSKLKTANDEQIKQEVTSGKDMMKNDVMADVFREESIEKKYNFNIWLKFDGSGNDRIDPNSQFPIVNVDLQGQNVYIQNYPFKVGSIKNGDHIYLAAVSSVESNLRHKNQPVIVGRAVAVVNPGNKDVHQEWLNTHKWMKEYPYYCVIDNIELLDTNVSNGIPLSSLWAALGSDMYQCSFGKGEDVVEVAKKHYQKAHMRLTGNAKDYLDDKLLELGKIYGIKRFNSYQ